MLIFIVQNVESYMSQIGQVLKMEIEESKYFCNTVGRLGVQVH